MGIGFVLLIWICVGLAAAAFASLVLGAVAWRAFEAAPAHARARARITACALPPAILILAGIGLVLDAASAEKRGFDPGFGDYRKAPLGSGYELHMLDSPEQAGIATPGGRQVAHGLLRLGHDDACVYAETSAGRFLLLDKRTRAETAELSADELETAVARLGGSRPRLRTASAVYQELREREGSVKFLGFGLLAAALLTIGCGWHLRRLYRRAMTNMERDAGWPTPRRA
ncbi:MAG: hypothetical protein FJ299_07745 [Planctomycetes bacterium]|nr:hypothetical protein [Planctomycetota bacterium]